MGNQSLIKAQVRTLLCLFLLAFSTIALAGKPVFETPDQKDLIRAAHALK